MRKLIVTLLFATSCYTAANAQVALEGGLNMANLSIKANDTKLQTKYLIGSAIGIMADIAVGQNFYFEPGVFYETNGAQLTDVPKGQYFINTVVFPLNIEYKFGEKCHSRFFLGGGPYIGNIISGSYLIEAYGPIPERSGELVVGSDIRKIDFGLGVNLGYQLRKHFYFRGHYQMGFTNLLPNGDDKNSLKTSAAGVTLGFLFGGCRSRGPRDAFGGRGRNHWRGMSKGIYSTKRKYTW